MHTPATLPLQASTQLQRQEWKEREGPGIRREVVGEQVEGRYKIMQTQQRRVCMLCRSTLLVQSANVLMQRRGRTTVAQTHRERTETVSSDSTSTE